MTFTRRRCLETLAALPTLGVTACRARKSPAEDRANGTAANATPAAALPPPGATATTTALPPVPAAVDPLAATFPELAAACPSWPLAEWPSPVEAAHALGEHVSVSSLWLKRDDRNAALYAGSKLRKLAYYLADARAHGAEEIVTLGALGSHQVVATAAHGRAAGFRVTALLASTPLDDEGRAHLLSAAAFGANLRLVSGIDEGLRLAARLAAYDPRTYVIPPGGSSPLGGLGFFRGGLELADDIRSSRLPMPGWIYLPLGTMGSATALALGLAAADLPIEVRAVRVANEGSSSRPIVDRLLDESLAWWAERDRTLARLARTSDLAARAKRSLVIVSTQLGRGYGRPTAAAHAAVEQARPHGLSLETTYTGKCFAALSAAAPELSRDGRPVVFWQTHNALPLPEAARSVEGGDDGSAERRALVARLPKQLRPLFAAKVRSSAR
jgi:1-aminocyclopropane-1-carboxylate deaminase/D-cysteine desulfhydrase-like pyridoxal-dependent ACC family enzyme